MLNYDKLNEREDVTPNKHPVTTGISSTIFVLVSLAFFVLAFHAGGCSSPPDNCSEVSHCGDDVDGGDTDQPDGNTTSTDGGQTQPDGNNANVCAANAWMEDPAMFNCDQFNAESGQWQATNSCDPELIPATDGCQIKCVPGLFWATPDQLVIHEAERYFDYINVDSNLMIRCTQRAQ